MRILSRAIFREILGSALLGTLLFVFVLFLRTIDRLSTLLVKTSAPPHIIAELLLYALPATLPFALPLGVLVGVLIGLSRMSADSEITAIRASGVSSAAVVRPVMLFASIALAITAACSLWLTPLSLHRESEIAHNFAAAQLTGNIESRVFDEDFPHTVVYVGDVETNGKHVIWHHVFLADTTPPAKLAEEGKDRGEGPRVIVAQTAIPRPDPVHNRIVLDMRNFHSYERDKEGKVIMTSANPQIETIQAQTQEDFQVNKTDREMDTPSLYQRVYHTKGLSHYQHVEAAIELHQRFALPLACVLLALVGIPLGISSRKGGKSTAFVLTVLLAFLYFLGFSALVGMAKNGSLPVPVAVWTPDAVFLVLGVVLLLRLEKPQERDWAGAWRALVQWAKGRAKQSKPVRARRSTRARIGRLNFRPMLIDAYVLSGFVFYLAVLIAALLLLIEVFTFFELIGDMMKNNISMSTMMDYLWHLAPSLIYQIAPIGILVATLTCFGVLTKHNEVTAFKAAGVSLYRLAAPVLVASFVVSVGLFAFNYYYIPQANRRQERLRAEIKNQPVATYLRKDRQWVYGNGPRIYNYRLLEPQRKIMTKVNVYELDPKTFQVVHQISAERAQWDPQRDAWVFSDGISEVIGKDGAPDFHSFQGKTAVFPDLTEKPSWFVKEEREYKEMNFHQLRGYIHELKESGLETTPLLVAYYKKFSVPLFALVMAIVSVPFAFIAGNRGAMTGVGISFGIAIAYWTIGAVFNQAGDLNQLPAMMAAWSPDLVFALAGFYFMTRMKT